MKIMELLREPSFRDQLRTARSKEEKYQVLVNHGIQKNLPEILQRIEITFTKRNPFGHFDRFSNCSQGGFGTCSGGCS